MNVELVAPLMVTAPFVHRYERAAVLFATTVKVVLCPTRTLRLVGWVVITGGEITATAGPYSAWAPEMSSFVNASRSDTSLYIIVETSSG